MPDLTTPAGAAGAARAAQHRARLGDSGIAWSALTNGYRKLELALPEDIGSEYKKLADVVAGLAWRDDEAAAMHQRVSELIGAGKEPADDKEVQRLLRRRQLGDPTVLAALRPLVDRQRCDLLESHLDDLQAPLFVAIRSAAEPIAAAHAAIAVPNLEDQKPVRVPTQHLAVWSAGRLAVERLAVAARTILSVWSALGYTATMQARDIGALFVTDALTNELAGHGGVRTAEAAAAHGLPIDPAADPGELAGRVAALGEARGQAAAQAQAQAEEDRRRAFGMTPRPLNRSAQVRAGGY